MQVHLDLDMTRERKKNDIISESIDQSSPNYRGTVPVWLRQFPPAETGGGGGGLFEGAVRIGIVVECRFVRGLVLLELEERGLMNGREGASMAEAGSLRCWRITRRPDRLSSSFPSSERCSKEGGGGDRVVRDDDDE
jgi:hypothetical protein